MFLPIFNTVATIEIKKITLKVAFILVSRHTSSLWHMEIYHHPYLIIY